MVQNLNTLQKELTMAEQWEEELSRKHQYDEAIYNRDKEILLHRDMARLRLILKLGRHEGRRN